MPDNTFIVNPDGLQSASVPLVALAERLGGAFKAAAARIAADGSKAWGNDKPGQRFAAGYVPVAEDIIKAGSGIHEVLGTSAENLRSMAKVFSNANENAMQVTGRLNGQIGGTQTRGGSGGGRGGRA
ncbi:hypothetical protein KBP30_14600 [Streptomyces sp. Go40/10]|uniref:hypothetical protein n=1 Tax=Streptomyces sp. Go40/10 TaxID=2825844 RepID=UPI001E4A24B4|nr:hypothetical protein [Streptomyces sp. Go40/10]UFR02334.1 hypothetical protein KBP30_14600 [Streptomyces sp. Go40/10]